MWPTIALPTLLTFLASPLVVASIAHPNVVSRAVIVGRDTQLLDTYDYVIVGGGASGLTVADRLTENPNGEQSTQTYYLSRHLTLFTSIVKVLVIEAGGLGYGEEAILVPFEAFQIPPQYYYFIPSVPLAGLNNRSALVVAGKVVGGGTAVNGMFMPRGSRGDYDIWKELGNPGWGFDDLLPYFIKVTLSQSLLVGATTFSSYTARNF